MKSTEPEFITIGKILSPRGTGGQFRVQVATDFPERFSPSSEVYIDGRPVLIESVDWHRGQAIVKLASVDTVEAAVKLRGQLLEIHHSQLKTLPEGQYYHFQLIGLEVRTVRGDRIGEITDILTMTSNDTYVVRGDRGEILIPAIEDVVKSVDLEAGLLVIEPMKGLLGLNEKAAK
jgi:16S rRNA processing protein RimM